jgi:2,3-diketo-5-methylthio-1-phosphopentane phosphatase
MTSGLDALLPSAPRVQLYVDFDGTIAPDEPTDALFERFAGPGWRELEAEVEAGRLSASDCASRQVGMLNATQGEMEDFLATRKIDPDFAEFVRYARQHGLGMLVVSDGFDLVIRTTLANAGLNLPFVANAMASDEDGRWQASFPYKQPTCAMGLGNCKCSHIAGPRTLKVMIGDGRSDFCVAESCNLVLAKGKLAQRCRERGVPHVAIDGFCDALPALAAWLATVLVPEPALAA